MGEDNVRSRVSTSSVEARSSGGVGTGSDWVVGNVGRSLRGEGVMDERVHASSVVCFCLAPGEDTTEVARAVRLAFFDGRSDGEGSTGELTRSRVSIAEYGGGVDGRS